MGGKPDGKTMAVNLHFYLTFNTMLTVIINTFLQDSSFFTAKKKEEGKLHHESLWPLLKKKSKNYLEQISILGTKISRIRKNRYVFKWYFLQRIF